MKIKIKQYLEENAFSLVAIFTSTFVLSEFWEEWMHVTLGLKVCMIIIWGLYIYAGHILMCYVKPLNGIRSTSSSYLEKTSI